MTGLGQHSGYLHWELLGFRRFKLLLWGSRSTRRCQVPDDYMHFCSIWNSNTSEYSRGSLHYNYNRKVIKLYIKKEQALDDAAFYVLLSARRATMQKITVLLMQAKGGLQAGARKECQTRGIYLVTCLLPLITQHYCLYSGQPNSRHKD